MARLFALVAAIVLLAGCGGETGQQLGDPFGVGAAIREAQTPPGKPPKGPDPPPTLPSEWEFKSDVFIVASAKAGDTAQTLAMRYLSTPDKAWMIEDFGGTREFTSGQEVVIPTQDWNPPGVYPDGYQLVPVLVYHNIGGPRKSRLNIGVSTFEEQMHYLKGAGYHPIMLADFLAHLQGKRQLPKKSVMLAFDDGHKGFLHHAHPLLRKLGFPAVLFIQSDQISARPNPSHLAWSELSALVKDGVEVQSHSKTHRKLRRASGEAEPAYARRMQAELEYPLSLLRTHLPRAGGALESIAYPEGEWDQNLLRFVTQYGYAAGFTVRREANAAFVPLLTINRSQVYSEWTLDEFKKNLNTFQAEPIVPGTAPAPAARPDPAPRYRQQLVAAHNARSQDFETRGWLHQALDEAKIALTIDPNDRATQTRRGQIEARIETEVATLTERARASRSEARRLWLAALALNPMSLSALEALRSDAPAPRGITHTVRPHDTAPALGFLYYCDRSRSENIEEANGLLAGAPLPVGRVIIIPEIPGFPPPFPRADC